MADVYELLSLLGKHVASLKLTSSWPSLVLTQYIVTTLPTPALSVRVENEHTWLAHLVVERHYPGCRSSQIELPFISAS